MSLMFAEELAPGWRVLTAVYYENAVAELWSGREVVETTYGSDALRTHLAGLRGARFLLACRFYFTDRIPDLTSRLTAPRCQANHPLRALMCSRAHRHLGRHLAAQNGYVVEVWT